MAKDLDYRSAASWVGHPYFDVIDNSTDFETKMNRMIECVCQKLGIDTGDRLLKTSRKLKYLGKWKCGIVGRTMVHIVQSTSIHTTIFRPISQWNCCPTTVSSPRSPTSRWCTTICSRSDRRRRRDCASAARRATGRTFTRRAGRSSTISRWRCARS